MGLLDIFFIFKHSIFRSFVILYTIMVINLFVNQNYSALLFNINIFFLFSQQPNGHLLVLQEIYNIRYIVKSQRTNWSGVIIWCNEFLLFIWNGVIIIWCNGSLVCIRSGVIIMWWNGCLLFIRSGVIIIWCNWSRLSEVLLS